MRRSPPVRMKRSGARPPRGLEAGAEQLLVDRRGLTQPGDGFDRKPARGLGEVPASAVGDRDDEIEPVAAGRARLGSGHALDERDAIAARGRR